MCWMLLWLNIQKQLKADQWLFFYYYSKKNYGRVFLCLKFVHQLSWILIIIKKVLKLDLPFVGIFKLKICDSTWAGAHNIMGRPDLSSKLPLFDATVKTLRLSAIYCCDFEWLKTRRLLFKTSIHVVYIQSTIIACFC